MKKKKMDVNWTTVKLNAHLAYYGQTEGMASWSLPPKEQGLKKKQIYYYSVANK
jgi:hypothetical protein